jgi:hypothetical protein
VGRGRRFYNGKCDGTSQRLPTDLRNSKVSLTCYALVTFLENSGFTIGAQISILDLHPTFSRCAALLHSTSLFQVRIAPTGTATIIHFLQGIVFHITMLTPRVQAIVVDSITTSSTDRIYRLASFSLR